jgi:RNA polymerase sigma factor
LQQKVNIKRAKLDLALDLGRSPTSKEVMQRLGLGVDRYHDILRTTMQTTSLHLRDRITGEEKIDNLADTDDASSMMLGGRNMLRAGVDDVVSHFLFTFASFTQQLRMLPTCECRCVL